MSPAWRRAELPVVAALALVTLVAALLVPTYPNYAEHMALVAPDGHHILCTLFVQRITRHAIGNFDAWR